MREPVVIQLNIMVWCNAGAKGRIAVGPGDENGVNLRAFGCPILAVTFLFSFFLSIFVHGMIR